MTRRYANVVLASLAGASLFLAGCGGGGGKKGITVGFSQIGAESDWRAAETQSIRAEAEKWAEVARRSGTKLD